MSMDFWMDRCLQSEAHLSHSVDADGLSNIQRDRKAMPTCVLSELLIVIPYNSYTMGYLPVHGDNPQALASGLS